MKLSCTPISFQKTFREGGMTLRSFLETCARLGLDGVDLLDIDHYPWFWASPDELCTVSGQAAELGLAIAAYSCGNNFGLTDPAARAAQVEGVVRALGRARDCGAPVVRLFGGYHKGARPEAEVGTSDGLELVIQSLELCLPHAERCGVVLALENHGRLPGHSYESRAIIDHFASPWLRATYDAANYHGNSMDEDEDPLRALDNLLGRIAHVHLKDVRPTPPGSPRKREACISGQGITPLRQVVAALAASGYTGYCALEYEAAATVPEAEGVPQSLSYLREALRSAALAGKGVAA